MVDEFYDAENRRVDRDAKLYFGIDAAGLKQGTHDINGRRCVTVMDVIIDVIIDVDILYSMRPASDAIVRGNHN